MKKITALLIALSMLCTAAGCGKREKPADAPAAESALLTLTETELSMGADFANITVLDKSGGFVLVFGEDKNEGYLGYITGCSFSERKEFRLVPQVGEVVMSACVDGSGCAAVLTVLDGETRLYTFGSDGQPSGSGNIGELLDSNEPAKIISGGDGYYISSGGKVTFVDRDMKTAVDVKSGGRTICGLCKDNGGAVTVLIMDGVESSVAKIEGTELADVTDCGQLKSSAYALCGGTSAYPVVGNFPEGLFGFDGSRWVMLSDYMDNGFNAYEIGGLLCFGDGEFAALKYTVDGTALVMLNEGGFTEKKPKKEVRVAYVGGMLTDIFKKYNQCNADGEYKIVPVEYSYGKYEDPAMQLKLDIISGNGPDIIYNYNWNLSQDILVDLYDYIDSDPDISREDFIPNILEGMSRNGRLTRISPTFTVNTILMKSEHDCAKVDWSYDEFIDACRKCPDGMGLFEGCDDDMMLSNFLELVNIYEFIDYEKGECSFDSPEFGKIIDAFRKLHIGMTSKELMEAQAGVSDFSSEYDPLAMRNDKYLFMPANFSSMTQFWIARNGIFGEELTFAGCPSSGGGTYVQTHMMDDDFSILKNAKEPDGAWDVIKFMLSEDMDMYYWGKFHVVQRIFDKNADKCLKNEPGHEDMVKYEEGVEPTYTFSLNPDGSDPQLLEPLTREQLDGFKERIYGAAKNFVRCDNAVQSIVYEELRRYFDGDISTDDAVGIIQDRVSTYLSEQYQ